MTKRVETLATPEIRDLILECLSNINSELDPSEKFEITDNMSLLGSDSALDSLLLVTLVMDIEAEFADTHQLDLTLVSDEAMSRARSPFRTVETLAEYANELVVTAK